MNYVWKSVATCLVGFTLTTGLAISTVLPAWAADPFRTSSPKAIGPEAQAAFELMFKNGDYPAAKKRLNTALGTTEANDPLVQAMRASVAYLEQDLPGMQIYAGKTRATAQKLLTIDPLRGHIYTGVSYLIDAGYAVTTQGIVSGTPAALGAVQKLLDEIRVAQEINPDDPELNLVKGYMDMLIATVLPVADLEGALSSLRKSSPDYLKWRGIALGYRDAKKPDQALDAVNKALAAAPNNPELNYLKGQILWMKDDVASAKQEYRTALSKAKQLPPGLTKQINNECTTLTGASCL